MAWVVGPALSWVRRAGAMRGALLAAALLAGRAHAEAPPCPPERLLWNGICQAAVFPPRDLDVKAFRRHPWPPTYLAAPPETIDIDVGRQLFVDSFLLENASATVATAFHQAEVAPEAVLRPTTRWEEKSTKAYSGGVWWDPKRGAYTAHYACSGCSPCHLCMATSTDGVSWARPKLQHDGSNCVHYDTATDCRVSLTTTTVWLDLDAPDPTTRYKLAEVPHCEPTSDPSICPPAALTSRSDDRRPFFKNGHFRIFGSGDGVEWKLLVNYTGEYDGVQMTVVAGLRFHTGGGLLFQGSPATAPRCSRTLCATSGSSRSKRPGTRTRPTPRRAS